MNDFTPPKFPKLDISQLNQLADYYEQLIDYYQYLANIARLNLSSVRDAIALVREELVLLVENEKQSIHQLSVISKGSLETSQYLNGRSRSVSGADKLKIDLDVTNKELKEAILLVTSLKNGL